MTKLNFAIAEIVDIYNFLPKVLAPKVVKVAVHASQSSSDRPSLAEQKNGNYWIVLVEATYWLLPQSGLRINQFNLATVKSLFDCQGYELSEHEDFVLLEAAQVSGMPNGKEWRLEKKGVLNFDPNYPAAELRSQLQQAQQEIDRLQSELEETRKQNNRLNAQVSELAYDTLQKIRADLVTRDEFIEQGRRVETWEEKLNQTINKFEQSISHQLKRDRTRKETLESIQQNQEQLDKKIQENFSYTQEDIKIISNIVEDLENNIRSNERANQGTGNSPTASDRSSPALEPSPQTQNSISLEESNLAKRYNCDRDAFSQQAINVTATEDSLTKLRIGSSSRVIFEKNRRGNYSIVKENGTEYLVPSNNLRLSQHNYKAIEHLFDCKNLQLHGNFKLLKPARVSALPGGETWQLEERGILQF
jgi:hypothetical protein